MVTKYLVCMAALMASTTANAATVTFSVSGVLDEGFGALMAGDPFMVSGSYDDAAPGTIEDGFAAYDSSSAQINFQVAGYDGSDPVLFSLIVAGSTFEITPPGDYTSSQVRLTFNLPTSDRDPFALPTQAQLEGSTGTATFVDYAGPPETTLNGSGRFTIGAVPEAATWAMMTLGFGMAGTVTRRRQRRWDITNGQGSALA